MRAFKPSVSIDIGDDSETVAESLRRLLPRLWRFALLLSGDPACAERLLLRACTRALNGRLGPGPVPESTLLIWSLSTLYATWLAESGTRSSAGTAQDARPSRNVEPSSYGTDSPAPRFMANIVAAVESLPDEQRIILFLVEVDGMSDHDISPIVRLPVDAVIALRIRARIAVGLQIQVASPGQGGVAAQHGAWRQSGIDHRSLLQ